MSTTATAPADVAPERPKKEKGNLLPRLSLPMTGDKSKLAVEAMTDPVRDRLRQVLADPELRAKLQLPDERAPAEAASELPATWDAGVTGLLADVAGKLLSWLAVQRGYPPQIAAVLEFTESEKTVLAEPTGAVLDKYFPGGLKRYGPEVVLLGAFAIVMKGKVAELNRMAGEMVPAAAAGGSVHQFPSAGVQ